VDCDDRPQTGLRILAEKNLLVAGLGDRREYAHFGCVLSKVELLAV
jgi:hypothetical protein